jgi:uncharacterized membrane protein HdeD (DUF308 family)
MRDHWWTFVLRGLVAIIFGVTAIFLPGLTIAVLVLLFGAFAFVEGLFAVIGALRGRHRDWGWHLVDGLIGIAIGIVTAFWPGLTALGLLYAIAAWAILTGLVRIAIAIRLRDLPGHPWFLGILGFVSVAVGIALLVAPVAGALAIVWLIGLNAIIVGALFLGLGFRVRTASA